MKTIHPTTRRPKTTSRKSAADALRKSDARYCRLFETEKDITAPVPHQLQNHLAKSLLMLDLLDLARDLAANVAIRRAEIAAFDQIAVAQIRRSFHIASRWASQFFDIRDETSLESNTTSVHAAIATTVKDLRAREGGKTILRAATGGIGITT
jgi:hypothetical protein